MKKILIFYASYGGGHLSAAKSVESVINEKYPDYETKLVDCMKYVNKGIEKITTAAYRGMAKKAPWAWGKIYNASQKGVIAHISTRSNAMMAVKLLKLLRSENPDIVISAHPFSSQMCAYLKRKGKINFPLATIMTDFAPHDQWLVGHEYTEFFFVAHDKMRNYLISKGIDESKVFATGIPISIRFTKEYNRAEILKEFNLKDNKKTILFFGGWNSGSAQARTLKIFDALANYSSNLQVVAISARNKKLQEGYEKIVKEKNLENVTILDYTTKVPELMSIANLVVAKPGGLTTSESLAMNLPMIIINPIAGQEEENAEFLEEKGIGIWMRKDDNIKEKIENLLSDTEKLANMKECTKILAHKFSSYDIIDIVFNTKN
ncbi:MAG: UDP-N-acetylglucosamine 2-epimerase [Clostridia bacterium]|nr:UDP-N-acetylglucosamine 2-epimerase [Clostridia bacterium]